MLDVIKQWVVVIIAAAMALPIGAWVERGLEASDGLNGVPIVLAASKTSAVVHVGVGCAAFGLIALAAGRVTHRYTGALVYGLCWLMVARRGADLPALARLTDDLGMSWRSVSLWFVLECFVWAAPAGAVVWALAKWTSTRYADELGRFAPPTVRGTILGSAAGVLLCWLMVRTDLKGQAVFGVAAGCAFAAMGVRMAWPKCNGSALYVIPLVAGVVGHLIGAFRMSGRAVEAVAAGTVWAMSRPTPMDYLTAGVFGVALGIGLARVFGHETQTAARSEATAHA